MEQKYLDRYEPWKSENGYNVLEYANWNEVSKETKAKMGEGKSGENNSNSRLSEDDVKNIKSDLKYSDLTYKELSQKYSVTEPMIRFIHRGDNWSKVTFEGKSIVERVNYKNKMRSKLSKNDVKVIMRELIKGDKTQKEIADMFNINESNVCRINNREKHTDISIPEDPGDDKLSSIRYKLSWEEAKAIKQEIVKYDKAKDKEIAEKFGYNRDIVRNIRVENTWSDIDVEGELPESNGLSKEDVVEIKEKLRDNPNIDYGQIAEQYDKNSSTIGLIARGKSYSEIEVEGFEPISKRLTKSEIIEIKKQLRDNPNKTYKEIGNEYNTTKTTIGYIARGESHSDVEVEGFEPR
jgi:transcriptional regulator with XRE-family HTH domain